MNALALPVTPVKAALILAASNLPRAAATGSTNPVTTFVNVSLSLPSVIVIVNVADVASTLVRLYPHVAAFLEVSAGIP